MIKSIVDECPGASSARRDYLALRIDRVLAEHAPRLVEVELSLRSVTTDGEERFEVVIRCDLVDGTSCRTSFVRPTLPLALASAFEATAYRLSVGRPSPTYRRIVSRRQAR